MSTENFSINEPKNNDLTSKDIFGLINNYETLAEAAQKAASSVLSFSEAAIIPDSRIETINAACSVYKFAEDHADDMAMIPAQNMNNVNSVPETDEISIEKLSGNAENKTARNAVDILFENMSETSYKYGGETEIKYMDNSENELNSIYETIMEERSLAVYGMTAGQQITSFNYYGNTPQQSSRSEKIVLENKADINVTIDKDVLGQKMHEWTQEYQRRTST